MNEVKKTVCWIWFVVVLSAVCVISVSAEEPDSVSRQPETDTYEYSYKETALSDVVECFSILTAKNVVATPDIQDLEITLYMKNIEPRSALMTLCKNYGLWFVEEPDVIRIMEVEEYARELILRRDEHTRVFNLKYASCVSVAETVSCIFGDRIEYEEPDEEESFGHVGTDDLPDIGDSDSSNSRNSNDSNHTYSPLEEDDGFQMSEDEYVKLRNVDKQGKPLAAEDLLRMRIGRARAFMTVFLRNNAVIVRSVDHLLLDDIQNLVQAVDTPTRQVLLEVKILEVTLGDGFDSFFDMTITPDGVMNEAGEVISDVRGVTGIDLVNIAGLADNSFRFEYMDKQLQATLELLATTNRVKKIATPIMLCANNAAAKFFQGVDTPVRKGYSVDKEKVETDNDVETFTTISIDYEEEELGVTLEISPSINVDRTVTLKIVSEVSTLNIGGGPTFYYTVDNKRQTGETDTVNRTTIEDIIVAMDGQGLALGGLIQEEDVDTEKKVPILGDIPWLGFFFKSKGTNKERSEIVFAITPHIIMTPEAAGTVNDGVMKDLSVHPYYKDNKEQLLEYDPKWDTLK